MEPEINKYLSDLHSKFRSQMDEAFSLFKERIPEYGDNWKTEEFILFVQNIKRKATGLKGFFDSGIPGKKTREDLLDLLNYVNLTLWRMDNENRGT